MSLANDYFDGAVGGNASPTNLNQPRGRTAGGPYMARLGAYQFSLETASFDSLQRSTDYRWAAQDRIGRDQAQQFLGMGEDRIELRGTIYPHFRGGLGQLALMREAAGRGKPLPLIYAFERVGQYNGLWCIKSVSDERSVPIRNGAARKIEFSLCLVAYGEDADISAAIEKKLNEQPASPEAGTPPPLSFDFIDDLLSNSLTVDGLVEIWGEEWGGTDLGGLVDKMLGMDINDLLGELGIANIGGMMKGLGIADIGGMLSKFGLPDVGALVAKLGIADVDALLDKVGVKDMAALAAKLQTQGIDGALDMLGVGDVADLMKKMGIADIGALADAVGSGVADLVGGIGGVDLKGLTESLGVINMGDVVKNLGGKK